MRRSFLKFIVAMYRLFGIRSYANQSIQDKHTSSLKLNKLCIIGIGGGGTNIANDISELDNTHMFIHVNSDYDSLREKKSQHKILLGWNKKAGLGCGGNTVCGKSLIDKGAKNKLNELTNSTKIVYVIASLGGGVGSGATPEIVEYLKSLKKKVIVFVTVPFSFEGKKRMASAQNAMEKIKNLSDEIVVFDNDTLLNDSKGGGVKDTFKLTSSLFYSMMKY